MLRASRRANGGIRFAHRRARASLKRRRAQFGPSSSPLSLGGVVRGLSGPDAAGGLGVVAGDDLAAALAPRARDGRGRSAQARDDPPRAAARRARPRGLLGSGGVVVGHRPDEATRHNRVVTADGRFAPSPTGTLHVGNLRTALVAWLFARSQDARYLVRMEDLDSGRVREHFYDEQLADLAALGLDWDGPVVRQSERIALYEQALGDLRAADLVYECWCTRAEIREAASAPHGDAARGCLSGHLPAPDRVRSAPSARRRAARPRCACAPTRRASPSTIASPGASRAWSTTSSCAATTAPSRTTWPWWSTTPTRACARSCAAPTCWTPPRASCGSARGSGSPPPATRTWRSCSAPTAQRLAKRHGAVTLADRAALGQPAADVRDELAASLGAERSRREPHARRAGRALLRRRPVGSGMSWVRTWLPVAIIVVGFVARGGHGLQRDRPGGRHAARLRRPLRLADQPALPHRRQGRSRARRGGPRTRLFRRARPLARRGAGPG